MPNNTFYYRKAFVHKSATFTADNRKFCNERLEYLGDSILDSIVADYLFVRYPNEDEGFLTKMRSRIVSRKSLNSIGLKLNLHTHIVSNIPNIKEHNAVGNAFEALVGAIYLDKGFLFTKRFVVNTFEQYLDITVLEHTDTNYKSQLLEYTQKHKMLALFNTETEHIISSLSMDVHSLFITIIYVDEIPVSVGEGHSKKDAEQNAAKLALETYGIFS